MSTRFNDGSQYENHQRAAELEKGATHAHIVGEQNGKGEYLTGTEQSRQANAHQREQEASSTGATVGHGIPSFGHNDIVELAHQLWVERGSPEGSPEQDWFRAVEQLRTRALSHTDPVA